MANPWDNDDIVASAPALASGSAPWENDQIEGEAPPLEIDIVGGRRESDVAKERKSYEGVGDMYKSYIAGVGKSMADSGRGLRQYGVDVAADPSNALGPLGRPILRRYLGQHIDAMAGKSPALQSVRQYADQLRADEAGRRELHPSMTEDPAFAFGDLAGTLGQIFTPGAAMRGTTASRAFLPTSLGGNALQGGALGTIQPNAEEGERERNQGAGVLAGAGGTALAKLVGAGAKGVRGGLAALLGQQTASGSERKAAQIIAQEAGGIRELLAPQPSAVPGVQRTLAEETLNPGVARLERQIRGQTNVFQPIDTANNAARVRAIDGFAGDQASLSAAEKARTRASKPLLGQAYTDRGVDVDAVRSELATQIKASATRPSVQSALLDVQNALSNAGDDVYSLYGVRKYIGDLLSGKAGTDKSYAKAASKELKSIQEVLDDKISAQSPSFSQYLDAYRSGSRPINRMQTGQQLLAPDSGGAVLDPQTGMQVLTPASFSRKARNLDSVAAKATGFKKARADQILEPQDLATIRAIQDDLERQSFRATAGSGGNSMTQERQALQGRMGRRLASKVPVVGGFVEALDQLGSQRVNERLAYLIANPVEARRVLAALNKQDREVLSKALVQLGGRTGASVPALAE
jgi:hypothetical protein